MMKPLLLLLTPVMLLFTSCIGVKFEASQPKDTEDLMGFPDKIIGIYLDKENDTLVITNNSFRLGSEKPEDLIDRTLTPGETVLKKYKDYYVISLGEKNVWDVYLFKYHDNELMVRYIDLEKENKQKIVSSLKEIAGCKEIKNSKGEIDYYLINPTKKEFGSLIKKGIFSSGIDFKRIESTNRQ